MYLNSESGHSPGKEFPVAIHTAIHTIATHRQPHFDEVVGIWLLLQFGEDRWPGIGNADLECWEAVPPGKTAKSLEAEGVLLVGIGGGPYDEHPHQKGRKEGQCAATLIAADLGIVHEPALRKILEFASQRDLELGKNEFELPAVVKAINDEWPPEDALRWAFQALLAIHRKQVRFYEEAPRDFRKAKILETPTHGGMVKMVVGRSDADTFCAHARSSHGCRAGVVIQMTSAGNVVIQTNQALRIDLSSSVRMLRAEELRLKGEPIPRDWKLLGGEKNVEPCWYLHPKRGMILNGSATCAAPPTAIPLETIEQIVRIGINPRIFHPRMADTCKQGFCASTREHPCPWYQYGLERCRANRKTPASQAGALTAISV